MAEVLRVYGRKDCPIWEGIVAAKNADTFGSEALPATEVRSIARSSARYSLRQYDREKFRQIQATRGCGGKAVQAKRAKRKQRIIELAEAGETQQEIARLVDCHQSTVSRIMQNHNR